MRNMKWKIYRFIFLILITAQPMAACAEQQLIDRPKLIDNVLIFPSGKKISFPEDKSEHIYAEKFELLTDDKERVSIVLHSQSHLEDVSVSIFAYTYAGDILFKIDNIFGAVFLLEDKDVILVARFSAHYKVQDSEIIDYGGKVIATLKSPAAVDSGGLSDDGRYIWLASENLQRPISYEVMVFDVEGNKVAYETSISRNHDFRIGNDIYRWDFGLSKIGG